MIYLPFLEFSNFSTISMNCFLFFKVWKITEIMTFVLPAHGVL